MSDIIPVLTPLLGYDTHGYLLHPLAAGAAYFNPDRPGLRGGDDEVVGFADARLLAKRRANRLLTRWQFGPILGHRAPGKGFIGPYQRHVEPGEIGRDVDQTQPIRD